MKKLNDITYICDEGKTFIRKSDGFDIGSGICLGDYDNIDNYVETPIDMTVECDLDVSSVDSSVDSSDDSSDDII